MSAIYFARVGQYVKIGFSSNPRRRVETLFNGANLIVPDDLDTSLTPELIRVVPFCRVRDERNMQILFARHWVVGEWFRWSPEFRFQMESMQFVTHATRLKDLRKARRDLGITPGGAVKEHHWGKQTPELLAELSAHYAAPAPLRDTA